MNLIKKIFILAAILTLISCLKPKTYYPQTSENELAKETIYQENLAKKYTADYKKNKKTSKVLKEEHLEIIAKTAPKIIAGGEKLCKIMHKKQNCTYEIKIKESPEENAYADGNEVFITTALLDFLENEQELALILAHEYAHNLQGHINAQMGNSIIGTILGGTVDVLATATLGVNTGSLFSQAGSRIATRKYSKEFEREADYVGLYIMALSGYEIEGAANLWRRFSAKDKKSIHMATTHPTNPERFIGLNKAIEEIKFKQKNNLALVPELLVE